MSAAAQAASIDPLQLSRPNQARQIQRLRYKFEEELEGGEPQRFKGYQDDTYAADATPGQAATANYAIMIYDVWIVA